MSTIFNEKCNNLYIKQNVSLHEYGNLYIKQNVSLHEYTMHKNVYDLGIVNIPKIHNYNENEQILYLEKIPNMSISDQFGTDIQKIPKRIMNEIRKTIKKIYNNKIIYIDITGYNFIFYDKKIWIIDFEHCNTSDKFIDDDNNKIFVEEFINGLNSWNNNFV